MPTTASVSERGAGGGAIQGACPGVHRPFRQIDGTLLRIRILRGVLTLDQLAALVTLAPNPPDTVVEITQRANVQLRGIQPSDAPLLAAALVDAGLAHPDPAVDARRNLLASPTAGIDPQAIFNTEPLASSVIDLLEEPASTDLAPTFGVVIDEGGAIHVRGRGKGLAFGAVQRPDGSTAYEVALGAPLSIGGDAASVPLILPEGASAFARAALEVAASEDGRLGAAAHGGTTPELVARVATRAAVQVEWVPSELLVAPTGASESPIGLFAQRTGQVAVGAHPVLGRLTLSLLGAVAKVAGEAGASDVRTTPWRSLLFTGVESAAASTLRARLGSLGFVVDPSDPALGIVACAGSTGCPAAWADVQADARALMQRRRAGDSGESGTVHFSGCEKQCAGKGPFDTVYIAGPGGYETRTRS